MQKLAFWYDTNLKISENNPFSTLKPIWGNVHTNTQGYQKIYEVLLRNPEKLIVATGNINDDRLEELEQESSIRLLIFENTLTGKLQYGCYMSVESVGTSITGQLHYKKFGSLTGTVLYYNMDGGLSNGWTYAEGRIVDQLSPITKAQYEAQLRGQAIAANGKTMAAVYECRSGWAQKFKRTCVSTGENTAPTCSWTQVGTEYVTQCAWVEQETIDHIEGGENGGGYFAPIFLDCADVPNGTAEWNPECQTCMGGTTGITQCPQDVKKTDSLKTNYPCLDKLIFNKLEADSGFRKLLWPFQGKFTALPDITYTYSNQKWDTTSYSLGNTVGDNSWNSTVNLNKFALMNASKLFIAVTLIHETAHAYSKFNIVNGIYGNPIHVENSAWPISIIDFVKVRENYLGGVSNYIDHSKFLEDYFDNMVDILKAWGGNDYTIKEYRMAALYGLNNPGTSPPSSMPAQLYAYNSLKLDLLNIYEDIKTKYAITSLELNDFNLKNIVNTPSNKKLPNTCP